LKALLDRAQDNAAIVGAQARHFSDLCQVYEERINALEAQLQKQTDKPQLVGSEEGGTLEQHRGRSVLQDERILEWLRANYGTPIQLPKKDPGKPWVTAECREVMTTKHKNLFGSDVVFEKSWGRVLKSQGLSDKS